jgi:hypothetical protein
MFRNKFVCILGIAALVAVSTLAQDKPGSLAALEFQKPKNGMVKQYEGGRKQKAEWHKQQRDPLPLYVWEVMTGDNTGSYIVGRLNQHWADLDSPPFQIKANSMSSTRFLALRLTEAPASSRFFISGLRVLRLSAHTFSLFSEKLSHQLQQNQ